MKYFFEKRTNKRFRGRKRATIVTTINGDIKRIKSIFPNFEVQELKSEIDLHNSAVKARNRKKWILIVKDVVKAAYSNTSQ